MNTENFSILVVDDDRDFADGLAELLEVEGCRVGVAADPETALGRMRAEPADIALIDIRLGRSNGLDLIGSFRALSPPIVCVVMTAYADVDSALTALEEGAFLYVRKPLTGRELMSVIRRCGERVRLIRAKDTAETALRARNEALQAVNARLQNLLGAARTLTAVAALDELMPRVVEAFVHSANAHSGLLYMKEGDELVLRQAIDPPDAPPRRLTVPLAPGSAFALAWTSAVPAPIGPIATGIAGAPPAEPAEGLVFPLVDTYCNPFGLMAVLQRDGAPFTAADREWGVVLASMASEAILVAQAHDEARRDAETTIRQQEALLRINGALFKDVGAALDRILPEAAATLDVARAGFWTFDDGASPVRQVRAYSAATRVFSTGPELDRATLAPFIEALRTHPIIPATDICEDARLEPLRAAYLDGTDTRAMLCASLWHHGHLAGFLTLEHAGSPRVWKPIDQYFADALCRTVSLAMEAHDREDAQQALQLTRFAVDSAAEGLCTVGPDGRIIDFNTTMAKRLGYSPEDLARLPYWTLDPDLAGGAWEKFWERMKAQGEVVEERRHRTRSGHDVPVEISATYFQYGGAAYCCIFARDIAERRHAEAERQRLEAQVQHAQKLESLGVLAGGIAHDFNNLLMGIMGNASLALMEMPAVSPIRQHMEDIETITQRATELCRQMLAYSGKGKFIVTHVNLSDIVREMAHLLEISVSKMAEVRYRFADGLPAIEGDPTQIRQIVMNLIINASDALGDQPGVVSLETGCQLCTRDMLAATYLNDDLPEGHYAYIEVHDTGCGMDDDTLDRIFDPFFTTKFVGRGLGMAAVLGIVRGHKGAIDVTSKVGQGTTFRVYFPVSTTEAARPAAPAPAEARWRGSATVLVVDDEETVRQLTRRMLERHGFKVITAFDGLDGVEQLEAHKDHIDLVVLDLTMPRLSGNDAYVQMHRIKPGLPVIVTSGYSEEDALPRFGGDALAGFIQKPFRSQDLLAKVRKALAGS